MLPCVVDEVDGRPTPCFRLRLSGTFELLDEQNTFLRDKELPTYCGESRRWISAHFTPSEHKNVITTGRSSLMQIGSETDMFMLS